MVLILLQRSWFEFIDSLRGLFLIKCFGRFFGESIARLITACQCNYTEDINITRKGFDSGSAYLNGSFDERTRGSLSRSHSSRLNEPKTNHRSPGLSHKSRRSSIRLRRSTTRIGFYPREESEAKSFSRLYTESEYEDMRQIATSSARLADRIRSSFRAIPSIKSISPVNDALKYLVLAAVYSVSSGKRWIPRPSFSPPISLPPRFSLSVALHLASSSRLHVVSVKFEEPSCSLNEPTIKRMLMNVFGFDARLSETHFWKCSLSGDRTFSETISESVAG